MRKVVLAVFLGACALSLLAAAPARANCYELIGCSNKDRYKVSESSRDGGLRSSGPPEQPLIDQALGP
jgi:hypothetical protein